MMAAAAVLAASGVVAGVVVAATPAAAGPTAATATGVVLVNQCTGKGQVRPSEATLPLPGCMTSNEFIGHPKWTSWRSVAFGSGNLEVNSCMPSCAAGKYIKYPILIVLWRARPWQGGGRYFSRMTWIYTGKRPPHAAVTHTVTWPSAAQ
jgi:hypothetical protein